MLAAREDLADKIGEIAEQRGYTVFGMVNDLLEVAIKVDNMGSSLKECVDAYELTKGVRDSGFSLVLESLLYNTAEIAYGSESEKTLKTWFDAGVWISQRYVARGVKDLLAEFEHELKVFGWNIISVAVERNEQGASIRLLSPRFSEVYTVLFNQYLEGFLAGCGYDVTFREIGRGNIRLEASLKRKK